MATNALATRSSMTPAALDELDEILRGGDMKVEIVDDPELLSRQIIAQLLDAESDEELEAVGAAVGWQDLLGVPVTIHGFRWRPSDFENSAIYLVVQGERMDTGEFVTLTTGSLNVTAQLSNLARRGRIPGAVRILTKADKPTKSGFYPLFLVSTPEEIKARQEATLGGK